MAMFQGIKKVDGSRSNTALVKSGHMSPAEEWLLDPKFKGTDVSSVFNKGVLFEYQYGGPGQMDVVIPKGRVVSVGQPIKDFVTKKYKTTITLPGLSNTGNAVGVVPYNLTKDWFQDDKFGGNAPSIITMDYITLPYIPGIDAQPMTVAGLVKEESDLSIDMKNPWGAVIGKNVNVGDYLKATPSGRLTKWYKTAETVVNNLGVSVDYTADSFCDVVGQVLAADYNQESWGWLKWMLWDETARNEDDAFMNRSNTSNASVDDPYPYQNMSNNSGASNLPGDGGYPFDPNYRQGNTTFQQYQNQYITDPTGIPGLHDGSGNFVGYGKNDTEYRDILIGKTPTTLAGPSILNYQAVGTQGLPVKDIQTQATMKFAGVVTNLVGGVIIYIDGVKVDPVKYTINYKQGVFAITLDVADAGDKDITACYKAYNRGTPSFLDFRGVVGSLNILLKK